MYFLNFLIGYIFIGTLAVIYHFFFEINDFFSLLIIIFGFILFFINFNLINKKEYLKLILLILIFSFFLFAYSDHPIDTNMYHHPFVSYLKSEKLFLQLQIFNLDLVIFHFTICPSHSN